MATKRRYNDGCAAAHALDLIGERWALLVVRELLLGPKRFTDLRAGLGDASSSRLSQRLHELEEIGVIRRRQLGPPAGTWVYELTSWGLDLEPVLTELGRWGRRSPHRDLSAPVSVDTLMLALRSHFDPGAAGRLDATYQLHIDTDRISVQVENGSLRVERGEAHEPDATLETDTTTFSAVMMRRQNLNEAIESGRVTLTGDADVVRRLLDALPRPEPAVIA